MRLYSLLLTGLLPSLWIVVLMVFRVSSILYKEQLKDLDIGPITINATPKLVTLRSVIRPHATLSCPNPGSIPGLGPVIVNRKADSRQKPASMSYPGVKSGGSWKPVHCRPSERAAIIVPYRDRENNLKIFLKHIHPFLQKQKIEYKIYVVEQGPKTAFNRAKLLNIGYIEASKDQDWKSIIFHDVDLLPTNSRNIYSCQQHPRHLSVAIDKLGFRLYYEGQFGGVSCMSNSDFVKVNGYSNAYFGWGAEDDDMSTRINTMGLKRVRYPPSVSRYVMASHKDTSFKRNSKSLKLLDYTKSMMRYDGLNNTHYTLVAKTKYPLFTKISVDFDNDSKSYFALIWSKMLPRFKWRSNHYKKTVYEKMRW